MRGQDEHAALSHRKPTKKRSMYGSGQRPSVLIPIAPGTNRNQELADAFEAAGAVTYQVPLRALRDGETKLVDHQILGLPGGFSYGDALGAGRLLGLDLTTWFVDKLHEAAARSMPVIGICNGFQALVRAGLLPGTTQPTDTQPGGTQRTAAALVGNRSGSFECRWVHLRPEPSGSIWLDGLGLLRCPVAHGEGRLVIEDDSDGTAVAAAFRYVDGDGHQANGAYPANPNGSDGDIAGLVDASGLVLGLMPHPEDHVSPRQDPLRGRGGGGLCLQLFRNAVSAVGE